MATERIDTLVIGAGQAGIAMSEHLGRAGVPHLVLERSRIAERWRSCRWDSLVANGPAWHDRFPGMTFDGDGEAFPGKEAVADYFEDYARQIDAPVRCGVEVTRLTRLEGRPGFRAETSDGVIEARSVVAATGPFQVPVIPPVVPETEGLTQIHSAAYRNPDALPAGAVLVVGAGSSGVQIADELNRAGREVYLSVGPHERPPRRYRGRDFVWWLGVLGKWDIAAPAPGTEHVTIAVSGANGGRTMDFRQLAGEGITLVGRTEASDGRTVRFAPDLARNIRAGDDSYLRMLDEADAHVSRNGLDLSEEPEARRLSPDPACMTEPLESLDLEAAEIRTIIWATGYRQDFDWIELDTFDADGRPVHQRGVSAEPGLYFLGLPWLSRRGSSFIWGVWHDARHIADQILIQRNYATYDEAARRAAE
ncbi:MAG: FAD-dependent oxidoreductase [Rhodobacteraceae bacterium]|jgi:putative flavoprotein involved in K+ transport|uniref:Putative flavoprotein involved in K+ transport n=1 Tax=Salipiger profundus TaxID=1229727 RepID=A0A1U7D3H8_9RHOB|nr:MULTISPECIES: NAD(P)/FAD-dependent oxidoreductase [Salipiger]APX22626.1 putative flavoprotein involved in K+ transport [Salipiger profundus]MAB05966.1 FAD-dependent oxidoreductase [Paracoccaceae bacterium]GGA10788.1 FAD-dependent oxidoreductase [Salipiger profundus]SFC66812.1 putative flavoprotein involved in K+ transport [Salipiger profundus]